jgi:hypothetical protein
VQGCCVARPQSALLLLPHAAPSRSFLFCPSEAPKLANRKTKAELEGMTEDEQVRWQDWLLAGNKVPDCWWCG